MLCHLGTTREPSLPTGVQRQAVDTKPSLHRFNHVQGASWEHSTCSFSSLWVLTPAKNTPRVFTTCSTTKFGWEKAEQLLNQLKNIMLWTSVVCSKCTSSRFKPNAQSVSQWLPCELIDPAAPVSHWVAHPPVGAVLPVLSCRWRWSVCSSTSHR